MSATPGHVRLFSWLRTICFAVVFLEAAQVAWTYGVLHVKKDVVLQSKVRCVDQKDHNQSCIFQNAYLCIQNFMPSVFLLTNESFPEIQVSMWGPWAHVPGQMGVDVHRFATLAELDEACPGNTSRQAKRGLHVLYSVYWHHNWVHATLDGLYPAYVALAKFHRHMENFTSILHLPSKEPYPQKPPMELALRLFGNWGGGGKLMAFPGCHGDCDKVDRLTFLDELIVGVGNSAEMTSTFWLPSSLSFQYWAQGGVLRPFVDRYLSSQGALAVPSSDRVKVLCVSNRRFGPSYWKMLRGSLSRCSEMHKVDCDVLDFDLGLTWKDILRTLSSSKVFVSGLGTALFNAIFLPSGSVTLNLGGMSQDAPGTAAGLPQYGEEFILASHSGMRVLYMPLLWIPAPTEEQTFQLISESVHMVRKGFEMPTKFQDNYSILGRILWDLAQIDLDFKALLSNGQKSGACRTTFPSEIVYESERGTACNVNWPQLRKLKVDYKLREKLNITQDCGDCVVCTACPKPAA